MNKLKKKMLVVEESLISSNRSVKGEPTNIRKMSNPQILGAENELTYNNPQKWGTAAPQLPQCFAQWVCLICRWWKELCNAL